MDASTSGVTDEPADRRGQLLDAMTYAAWSTAVFAAVSALLAVAAGWRPAPGVKYGLFVFGWLAFGYATFQLLPSRPWRDGDGGVAPVGTPAGEETGFQALVQRLPPARWRRIPVVDRVPTGVRLFLASLAMLGTSLVLERVLGIGP